MNKIWIDLTDIDQWTGQHGGMQRVVYGITRNFYLDKTIEPTDLGFIRFSAKKKKFYESSFAPIYERVEANKEKLMVVEASSEGLEDRLKRGIRPYVPLRILENNNARHLAKKTGKKAINSLRTIRSLANSRDRGNESKEVKFAEGDTVLIMGSPWDSPEFQTTLSRLKLQANFKLVQVLYDLIIPLNPHLHHQSLFVKYTRHMFEAIAATDLFLSISQSSADDLRRLCDRLNLTFPKTEVIRLGDEIVSDKIKQRASKPDMRVSDRFIICVGTIEIRKNHMLLYNSYKLAEQRGIDLPQLVIVGRKGWLSHDVQYLITHDPIAKAKILILDKVSDAGLSWLYQNSILSVYPSIYEGWGLPVAESLSYGKMCVASNTSSVPEIAGDLIEYFSPYDSHECLEVITNNLDPEILQKKQDRIRNTYKATSWEQTNDQVRRSISQI